MITSQEWDKFISRIDELDKELNAIRTDGSQPVRSLQTEPSGPSVEEKAGERVSRAVPDPGGRQSGIPPAGPSGKKQWDASSILLEEDPDQLTWEDLQCYQIRKKSGSVSMDQEMEEYERAQREPVPAWDDKVVTDIPPAQLYLHIEKHLASGKLSDTSSREMVLIGQSPKEGDTELKMFYPLYTLLQSDPSGERIEQMLSKAHDHVSSSNPDSVIAHLETVIQEAYRMDRQNKKEQDRRYINRQSGLDRDKEKAESDYDKARRRTDRWR